MVETGNVKLHFALKNNYKNNLANLQSYVDKDDLALRSDHVELFNRLEIFIFFRKQI